MRGPLSAAERNRRLLAAAEVAQAGGSAKQFGERVGLKPSAAANWIKVNDADLHRQLTGAQRGRRMDRHQALVRLLLLKSVEGISGGQARLAAALGTTRNSLAVFKAKWAADGLDAAIADLMPEDAHG